MFQMNYDPSIPVIQLFQNVILKIQGKGHGRRQAYMSNRTWYYEVKLLSIMIKPGTYVN